VGCGFFFLRFPQVLALSPNFTGLWVAGFRLYLAAFFPSLVSFFCGAVVLDFIQNTTSDTNVKDFADRAVNLRDLDFFFCIHSLRLVPRKLL
jgi:hypothetical protein